MITQKALKAADSLFKTPRLKRPAAVALRSLFNSFLALSVLIGSASAFADSLHAGNVSTPKYVAKIQAHTPSELNDILSRLDSMLQQEGEFPSSQPLALVLHGDEAEAFLQKNYQDHRALVDLAARLDAFNAVDIQICETWLRGAKVKQGELPAFVDTVPYGPAVEEELLDDGYEYF